MSNYEKTDKMWDEGFLNPLPECISQHIADDLELNAQEKKEWVDTGELWGDYQVLESGEPIDGTGAFVGREYRYTPYLWSFYLFWKNIKKKKIKENYLLGEIIWFLIYYLYVDEPLYQQINHKKEKGWKETTFNESKQQLQFSLKGKPWIKKEQMKHGSIIKITNEGIVLSNSWRELLECTKI